MQGQVRLSDHYRADVGARPADLPDHHDGSNDHHDDDPGDEHDMGNYNDGTPYDGADNLVQLSGVLNDDGRIHIDVHDGGAVHIHQHERGDDDDRVPEADVGPADVPAAAGRHATGVDLPDPFVGPGYPVAGFEYARVANLGHPADAGYVHALIADDNRDAWVHIDRGLAHVYLRLSS